MPKKKKPGAEAVLSRARQMVRAEKRKLWEQLGLEGDFDESKFAEKLAALKAGANVAPSAGGDGDAALRAENAKLKAKLAAVQHERRRLWAKLGMDGEFRDEEFGRKLLEHLKGVEKAKAELAKKQREIEDSKIEAEIRGAASGAGFVDPDYGTDLYRRHVAALAEDAKVPAASEFFEELRKDAKKKFLFEPARVPAGPQQRTAGAGEEGNGNQPSGQNGNSATPPEPANGKGEGGVDATKMGKRDFARYAREQYGFAPGS